MSVTKVTKISNLGDINQMLWKLLSNPTQILQSFFKDSFTSLSSLSGFARGLENLSAAGNLKAYLHYLIVHLICQSWIATDGEANEIPHLLLIPALFFSYVSGPVGLMLYIPIKTLWTMFFGVAKIKSL